MHVPYSLYFSKGKTFTDFTDFCQAMKILALKFLSVNHEKFIQKMQKFINPLKYSPSKHCE